MLMIDVCFVDQHGAMSCMLTARFFNSHHAEGYVRGILRTPRMRQTIAQAELHSRALPAPLILSAEG